MCKAVVDVEKVVPIYGRGNDFDPRVKLVPVPPRPAGQQPFIAPQVIKGGRKQAMDHQTCMIGHVVADAVLIKLFLL